MDKIELVNETLLLWSTVAVRKRHMQYSHLAQAIPEIIRIESKAKRF